MGSDICKSLQAGSLRRAIIRVLNIFQAKTRSLNLASRQNLNIGFLGFCAKNLQKQNFLLNKKNYATQIIFAKQKGLCCSNFEHCCSTNWTFSFHCRFTIFHSNSLRVCIFSFCSTFYTIHACHNNIHLLSKTQKRDIYNVFLK